MFNIPHSAYYFLNILYPKDIYQTIMKRYHCENMNHRALVMTWLRHEMETFSALLAICAEDSPVTKVSDEELWCFLFAPE